MYKLGEQGHKAEFIFEICKVAAIMMSLGTVQDVESGNDSLTQQTRALV